MAEVTRWPISTWKRIKNRRGQRTLNCQISDRYIAYGKAHDSDIEEGALVMVNVMTDRSFDDRPDHKLCELALSLNELKAMVATMENDLIDTTRNP